MTEYNLELEQALKRRPLPEKQATVAMERILSRKANHSRARWTTITAISACFVALMIMLWTGDAPPWNKDVDQSSRMSSADLSQEDWEAIFDGDDAKYGMEVLHREPLTENSQLLFIVKAGNEPYRYRLFITEYKRDKSGSYRMVSVYEKMPFSTGVFPEGSTSNSWITYDTNDQQDKENRSIPFAFGYVRNDRVTQITLNNHMGTQENASIFYDEKGVGFWFALLSPELADGTFEVQARSRHGDLLSQAYNNSEHVRRSSQISALTSNEWKDLIDGVKVGSNIEVLSNEQLGEDIHLLFLLSYDRQLPKLGYKMAVAHVERRLSDGQYQASMLSMGVWKNWAPGEGPSNPGNAYFVHTKSISTFDHNPPTGQIFGLIRDDRVAAIKLSNESGDQVSAKLISNTLGDTFFFVHIPDEWLVSGKPFYIEALDDDGASLKKETEYR